MKKNYLFVAGLASMMAFSACSNDDDLAVPATPVVENDGTMFEIAISTAGEGAETRAVRPVGSSAAANNVNKIVVKIWGKAKDADADQWTEQKFVEFITTDDPQYDANTLGVRVVSGEATKDIITNNAQLLLNYDNEYVAEDPNSTNEHFSKKANIQLGGLEEDYQYKFVAYGYNAAFPGTPTEAAGKTKGVFQANQEWTTDGQQPATVTPMPYADIEEVFATSVIANTTNKEDDYDADGQNDTKVVFTDAPTLTLTRQVAGMLAYFEKVPTYVNGMQVHKVQIVANQRAKDFYFPNCLLDGNGEDEDFNGIIDADAKGDILMEFDMAKIATNFNENGVEDNYYQFNTLTNSQVTPNANVTNATANNQAPLAENYNKADGTQESGAWVGGLSLKENTMFGGRYILPYDKDYIAPTLQIVFLTKEDGKYVEIPEGSKYITTDQTLQDTYSYDIRCNNFYSIGDKELSDQTKNDDPLNLSGDEFKLRINDAWGVLHHMDVDDND